MRPHVIRFMHLICGGLVAVALVPAPVHAEPIVFTGPGASCCFGFDLDRVSWLAAQFTVNRGYTITSVEGWMERFQPGDLTVTLYYDAHSLPGRPLLSKTQSISAPALGWAGASQLAWMITPGTYWAAFEVPNTSTFDASMWAPSASPVGKEAFNNVTFVGRGWLRQDDLDLGLRILGDPLAAPVPEPATFVLVSSGLGLFATRRHRRRNS
jgi:hypothetical protein